MLPQLSFGGERKGKDCILYLPPCVPCKQVRLEALSLCDAVDSAFVFLGFLLFWDLQAFKWQMIVDTNQVSIVYDQYFLSKTPAENRFFGSVARVALKEWFFNTC
jgi:hypothetical protein